MVEVLHKDDFIKIAKTCNEALYREAKQFLPFVALLSIKDDNTREVLINPVVSILPTHNVETSEVLQYLKELAKELHTLMLCSFIVDDTSEKWMIYESFHSRAVWKVVVKRNEISYIPQENISIPPSILTPRVFN